MLAGVFAAALDRPMPAFLDAGTGAVEAPVSGTLQVPYPATVAAGNFLFAHIVVQDSGGVATIATPSGWTSADTRANAGVTVRSRLLYKIATGSESGNLDVTCTADTFAAGRIYRFSGGSSVEAVSGAITAASGTALTCINITTLGQSRRALQFFSALVNTTVGNVSGETNADYTEAVAEYATATGGGVILSCQAASVPVPVAITGGSATLASAGTERVAHGLAIVP